MTSLSNNQNQKSLKELIYDFTKAKDQTIIRELEVQIYNQKEINFEQSIYTLTDIITDEKQEVEARQFSGVLFNNFILRQKTDSIKWMNLPGRENLRGNILAALASDKLKIRKIVSSVVASK